MPKIYVADQTENSANQGGKLKRFATGSMTTLKNLLKQHADTEWNIGTYIFKADVLTICQIIEDWDTLKPDETETVRVNSNGRFRKNGSTSSEVESEEATQG